MNKISKCFSIEIFLSLLFIFTYFMPWVDMGLLIKVVGWDLPQMQKAISEMSKEFVEEPASFEVLYGIYIIPILAFVGVICDLRDKTKAARYILATSSILSIILSAVLYAKLPNVGSGVYMLVVLSILSLIYVIYSFRAGKQ